MWGDFITPIHQHLLSGHQSEIKFMEYNSGGMLDTFYIITVGCCSDRVISLIADQIGNIMLVLFRCERKFTKKRKKIINLILPSCHAVY